MFKAYCHIIHHYSKISLVEERKLISKAQKGSKKSKDELVLRHIGFIMFRIRRMVFPEMIQRFGDDLLTEAILIVYKKVKTYKLDYRNKRGDLHPVRFVSYIWKRIDGFIIDSLKKELNESNFYDRYKEANIKNGDLSPMSRSEEADIFIS